MTPGDMFGASIDPYGGGYYDPYGSGSYDPYGGGGSYDPYGGGGSYGDYDPYGGYDPYGSGMSGSPAPWYTDRGLPIPSEGGMYGSYDPYGGGGYDPYAAEDARLSSLAAGMPDSTAPSFGSGGMSGSPAPWYTDRDLPIPSESGVPSAPTSSPSDYYSSPEWLRMLASIQGGLASGAI